MKIKNIIKKYNIFIVNFFISFFIIIILFLSFYPGIMTYDSYNQWQQVQSGIITNAHPFFSTYFMYLLSKIHNSTTIVFIFQIFIFSLIWSCICYELSEIKRKKYISYICTIVISFLPIVSIYSFTMWKDILYSYYLVLIAFLLYKIFVKQKHFTINFVILGIILALPSNYRHNGIIVTFLLLLLLLFFVLKKRKNIVMVRKVLYTAISFVIVSLIIFIPKNNYLNKARDSKNDKEISISTIDTYILWMMGSHIRDNNITDKKDLKFLNKIINIDEWKKVYNPYLINSTSTANSLDKKMIIRKNKMFKNIFLKYSLKHPKTLIIHYLKADSLLINPISMRYSYVYVFDINNSYLFNEYDCSKIPVIKKYYSKMIDITYLKPFKIFYQPAFILYLCLLITIILQRKVYGKKLWIFLFPMLANTISLLPINLAQDLRYVYINYLTFFVLLLMFILNIDKIFIQQKSKE